MESEPNKFSSEENTSDTDRLAPLKRVTPLSKYLAMALFVLLPFVGAWIGYSYGSGQIGQNEDATRMQNETGRDTDVGKSPTAATAKSFNGRYGGARYGTLTTSPDGTKKYFISLPEEGVCCDYIHFTQTKESDNNFDEVNEYTSLEEVGLVYQHTWPVSPDGRYLVLTTFSDQALPFCDQGMNNLTTRTNNIIKVLNLNTSEVQTVHEAAPEQIHFYAVAWSEDNSEIITERTSVRKDESKGCVVIENGSSEQARYSLPDGDLSVDPQVSQPTSSQTSKGQTEVTSCEVDSDCTLVQPDCEDCTFAAIHKNEQNSFQQEKQNRCELNPPQTMCDIAFAGEVKCVENTCQVVE